ncbi:MAG: hypothetical protein C0601_13395 [Candidatus Muiribacterium halophilum]|uniref:Type II secretion system protein GspG C-terminal domain-containing protein n=1 Tax=Muiribacterium halophilum TaxID=2053465 RepID=A0A2N5Z9H5_MUIH1|nr:MAG: hypothetical protein C0601_13395 [Candidatus Muirbacterium halophilum]
MKNRKEKKGFANFDFFFLFIIGVLIITAIFLIPQYSELKGDVGSISCSAIRTKLGKIVEQYKLENSDNDMVPDKPIDIIMLKEKNYTTGKYLYCPSGGVYMINSAGQVYCTKHNPELADQ